MNIPRIGDMVEFFYGVADNVVIGRFNGVDQDSGYKWMINELKVSPICVLEVIPLGNPVYPERLNVLG